MLSDLSLRSKGLFGKQLRDSFDWLNQILTSPLDIASLCFRSKSSLSLGFNYTSSGRATESSHYPQVGGTGREGLDFPCGTQRLPDHPDDSRGDCGYQDDERNGSVWN